MKKMSEMWNALSEDEKAVYNSKYLESKEEYAAELSKWEEEHNTTLKEYTASQKKSDNKKVAAKKTKAAKKEVEVSEENSE